MHIYRKTLAFKIRTIQDYNKVWIKATPRIGKFTSPSARYNLIKQENEFKGASSITADKDGRLTAEGKAKQL